MLATLGLLLAAVASAKEDCVPPRFYAALPRDREWYYGAARDVDTDKARDLALRSLGKQVTGDVESWQDAEIEKIAGPCRDRWEVARQVGKLLPQSTLLAGWEQDDFERCGGQSYVLVRVEKERVARFIRENARFKDELAQSLSRRVEALETGLEELGLRVDRLARLLGELPPEPKGESGGKSDALRRRVAALRADIGAGKPAAAVAEDVAAAEKDYETLRERMRVYRKAHDAAESHRRDALAKEKTPELEERLAKLESRQGTFADTAAVISIYDELGRREDSKAFCRRVLDGAYGKSAAEGREDWVAYMIVAAHSRAKDWDRLLEDGEDFLKRFPGSDMYQAVRASMEGAMAMKSLEKGAPAAPAVAVAAAPAPCPRPPAASAGGRAYRRR